LTADFLKKAAAAAASITLIWLKVPGLLARLGTLRTTRSEAATTPHWALRASRRNRFATAEAAPRADCHAAVWRPIPLSRPHPGYVDPRPLEKEGKGRM